MIITKTPMRISFFGGGTDYPVWFNEHGGSVLSATIDKYTYISVRWLPPFFEHKYRVVWSRIENVNCINEIYHPAVRECLRYLDIQDGIVVNHDGDLPACSGMGTSSTFTVGLLHALHALKGECISKTDLAQQAIYVEQQMVKDNVGNQDQVAAAFGGFNRIYFSSDGFKCQRLNLDIVKRLESHLILIFTGFPHNASDIAGSYKFDTSIMAELQSLVPLGEAALSLGDFHSFGQILDESWRLKCGLSPQISTPYIDFLYERARKVGAVGGKLLGAGGGGFMLLVCEPERQKEVKETLKGLLFVPFHFKDRGSHILNGEVYVGSEPK